MGEPFRHTLRVRFNECDPQGVVFEKPLGDDVRAALAPYAA